MSFFDSLKRLFGGSSGKPGESGGMVPPGPGDDAGMKMISCEEARAVLYEYLDGELEGLSYERVKAHFDICARCYPKLSLEKSFLAAVEKAGSGEKAPPELRTKVLGLLADLEKS
jgi:mycothiol system anti-sigma-R factor